MDKFVLAQADDAQALSLLGQIDAALGRKEEALRESRRACELVPLPKDALQGARLNSELTIVYAWIGEKDLALAQLAISAQMPVGAYYGALKLDPEWDSLRGDPRFEKIVASLAPQGTRYEITPSHRARRLARILSSLESPASFSNFVTA